MKKYFALFAFICLLASLARAEDSPGDFQAALRQGNREQVEYFLKRHRSWATAELDEQRTTPLSMAIAQGDDTLVELLLKRGAKADSPPIKYRPPIFFAISTGNLKVVKVLLQNGAKVNGTDFAGMTPLKYAEHMEQTDIEELLRQYGGR